MTWKAAVCAVLNDHPGVAMHSRDIAEEILSRGLRDTAGATPDATVNSQIVTSLKQEGDKSPFIKVDRGLFAARQHWKAADTVGADGTSVVTPQDEPEDEGEDKQYEVITSFGMFWQREKVFWKRKPHLFGAAHVDSKVVDFSEQYGIYLLYDGREVIYVGRVLNRALGTRLFEHTQDRLSARWDRFSWFGLRGITDSGKLLSMDDASYSPDKLIPALEAILIEAVEPRQNRKRGDDLGLVEFIQKEDPQIRKQQRQEVLNELMANSGFSG